MQLLITSLDRIEGVEALREAQRTFNAAGFVIVPKEPTEEMIKWGSAETYMMMIEAAPKLV
jgi:hypothetical protein